MPVASVKQYHRHFETIFWYESCELAVIGLCACESYTICVDAERDGSQSAELRLGLRQNKLCENMVLLEKYIELEIS